jgi:hypothetical protein
MTQTDAEPMPRPDGACMSFAQQLNTCLLPNENAIALMLSGDLTLNTDTGVLKNTAGIETPVTSAVVKNLGGDEMRVLVATSVTLTPNTKLRATGVRGFAIVAREAITLQAQAVIDVSRGGAGYRSSCGTDSPINGMPTAGAVSAGAGGGGGGFGAAGGDGGNGNADGTQTTGGAGGKAVAAAPTYPIGGCSGGKGGLGDDPLNPGGAGGAAGGTVYLVSTMSISIANNAGIDAGGDGGLPGMVNLSNGESGGGGGGSGGSIFLEAPVIRSDGILVANGGGGGEGSGLGSEGRAGSPGVFGLAPANGGKGGSGEGADGGDGGFVTTPAGQKPTQIRNGGGGGGGGGVGFIRVKSPDAMLGTKVSPPATVLP